MLYFRNMLLLGVLLIHLSAFTQTPISSFWTEAPPTVALVGEEVIQASSYRTVNIDVDELKDQLQGVKHRNDKTVGNDVFIELPHPDGGKAIYQVFENNTMHPGLKAKFPEIRSYDAVASNGDFVKLDITPHGFHAMIFCAEKGMMFIDPYSKGDTEHYKVYFKRDFITDKHMDCGLLGNILKGKKEFAPAIHKEFGTCELRTYRFAVAATGEYTAYHGGTVALAAAAQVTTMNRVNGVYERDMAITMEIIPNNDLIIFTNSGTDPYTNGTPGSMINENQVEIDNTIGSGNYDIGHVFGTNSGGLAGLGVVCSGGQKARGVTGSANPIGDPFDIDYVAHETGHQFGANHTQNNNCNRNNATAMEPGSASTIMGYAGICAPNVQSNSDDHFHGISLQEIHNEITSHGCPVITSIANTAPTITGTNGNVTVPANTPFALTAFVTDPDGDALLYCWEQMDNAAATMPPDPSSTDGPNFRSNSPVSDSTRYFPNLTDLAAGITPTWEVVPSVSRTMNFRVTVRDQSIGVVGCNDHADVTVTTDAGSGPFIVTYPSASGITWIGNGSETVTWNVANTDVAPVSCDFVDIFLSTDGGATYPFVLATNVPNDGSETITVPNVGTTTARVMVMCSNGTFFDISDNDFEISLITSDFTLDVTTPSISVCQPDDAVYNVDIGTFGGYTDPVTLNATGVPAGGTGTFGTNPVTPGNTTTFTVSNTGAIAAGTYTITVEATSTTGTKTEDVTLIVSAVAPTVTTLTSPADGATGEPVPVTFNWSAGNPGDLYDIDIATDPGFATIVDNAVGLTTNSYVASGLASGTVYYWRVNVYNACGDPGFSSTFSFETINEVVLPTTGTLPTQTTCTGILFDSGGSTGGYTDNEDSEVTISPTGAATIDLTFVSFDIEPGSAGNCDYDWLEIYDGPTTGSPLIDRYCNDNIPTTLSSTGSSLTIVFHSDGGVTHNGFEMQWQCQLSTVPPTTAFSSDVDTTCTGSISFTDESSGGPTQWLWDFGDGNTSTSQNPTHIYTANGDYNVSLITTNANGSDTLVIGNMIHVNLPVAPTTTGDEVCGTGSMTLSASGSGTLDWYDAPTGGSLVNSGVSYVTPILTSTTNYYVESVISSPSLYGAKPDNSGGGANFNNDQHLKFDVYTDMIIVSVEVYATGTDNRTIELRDDAGTVINSLTVNIPDGTSRVTLNFPVSPGTDYQLGIDAGGTIDLYRNNASVSYPYDLAGLGSITRSSAATAGGMNHYYFFYDWEIKGPDCVSARTPVEATVHTLPTVNAGADVDTCEGSTVVLSGSGATSYSWTGGVTDGVGFVPPTGLNTYTVTGTDVNGCTNTDDVTVNVNAAPTVDAGTDQSYCAGESVTLSGTGASFYAWSGGVTDGDPFPAAAIGTTTYFVTGTDVNGCSNMDSVDITVYALPSVDSTNATDATTCTASDGTITINVSGGSGAYTYSVDGGATYVSNGGMFTGLAVGTYNLMVDDGNCPVAGGTLTISSPGAPAAPTASGGNAYCDGDALNDLTASGSTGTFNWYSDAGLTTNIGSGSTLTPSTAIGTTTYYVTETLGGCEGPSSSVDVTIYALPTVEAGPDQNLCEGQTTTVNGSGASSYTWTGGVTDGVPFSPPLGTNVYVVTGEDANTCQNIDSLTILVIPPPDTSVTDLGGTLQASSGLSYQWLDCSSGPIPGETSQTYMPLVDGSYAVVVSNGACSDTSACLSVIVDDVVEEALSYDLSIYPNPSEGMFFVEIGNPDLLTSLKVMDATGRLVKEVAVNGQLRLEVNISEEAAGLYFFVFNGDVGISSQRIIKK